MMDAAERLAAEALAQIEELVKSNRLPDKVALTQGRDDTGMKATELVAGALRRRGIQVEIVPVQGDLSDPVRRATIAALEARPVKE